MEGELKCENCFYWVEFSDELFGECRRNPPTLIQPHSSDTPRSYWPKTSELGFCGEHRSWEGRPLFPSPSPDVSLD